MDKRDLIIRLDECPKCYEYGQMGLWYFKGKKRCFNYLCEDSPKCEQCKCTLLRVPWMDAFCGNGFCKAWQTRVALHQVFVANETKPGWQHIESNY